MFYSFSLVKESLPPRNFKRLPPGSDFPNSSCECHTLQRLVHWWYFGEHKPYALENSLSMTFSKWYALAKETDWFREKVPFLSGQAPASACLVLVRIVHSQHWHQQSSCGHRRITKVLSSLFGPIDPVDKFCGWWDFCCNLIYMNDPNQNIGYMCCMTLICPYAYFEQSYVSDHNCTAAVSCSMFLPQMGLSVCPVLD